MAYLAESCDLNPANNQITIAGKNQNDNLKITITDLTGRKVLTQNLKTANFIATLDLALINGAYFVNITNSNNETVIKKLLIAK